MGRTSGVGSQLRGVSQQRPPGLHLVLGSPSYLPIVNGSVFELLVYIESPANETLTLTTDCFWCNLMVAVATPDPSVVALML